MKQKRVLGMGVPLLMLALPAFGQTDAPPSASDAAALNGSAISPPATPSDTAIEGSTAPLPPQASETAEAAPEVGAPAKKSGNRFVEEVIVTAQKREENLQDVPISVSAFSAEALDARGVSEPKDLQLTTPGLNFGSQAGFSIAFLRGVGSNAFLLADPSVALYIDGVYFPFAHGLAQSFGALERIEVLKGPQGTLFGRNALGGAINIITKTPSDKAETSIQSSATLDNHVDNRLYTNIPIGDKAAISLSALYNVDENYYKGTVDGHALPEEISRGVRVKFHYTPFENTDITLAAFVLQEQGLSTMFALNDNPFPLGKLLGVQAQTGYRGSADAPDYYELNNRVLYGQVTQKLDWFDLKVLGSAQYANTPSEYDFDGSPVPIVSFEAAKLYADVQSGEFQILSNGTSWGSRWLKWIGGFYYFNSSQGFDPVNLNAIGLNLGNGTIAGIKLPPELLGPLEALPFPIPNGNVTLVGTIATRSYAGFGQATVNFTDWLALTLGGRYQSEHRQIIQSSVNLGEGIDPGNVNTGQLGVIQYPHSAATTNKFSPKVSLELHPFDDTLVYASWQEATKSATFNVINIYRPPSEVKPETLRAYEVGVKTKFFGGLMQLDAAAFEYRDSNLQVQFISLLNGGAVSFQNAGGSRTRGVDADTVIQLFPSLIDNLVFTAGGAYLDAVYTDYTGADGFDEKTGIFFSNGNYNGRQVERTPKFSGDFGLSKTVDTQHGPLEVAGDVYYSSHFSFDAQNSAAGRQDAYEQVNAHVSYLYEPWGTRLTVFGQNLTDKSYSIGKFIDDFGVLDYLSRPRTFGLRLNVDF